MVFSEPKRLPSDGMLEGVGIVYDAGLQLFKAKNGQFGSVAMDTALSKHTSVWELFSRGNIYPYLSNFWYRLIDTLFLRR